MTDLTTTESVDLASLGRWSRAGLDLPESTTFEQWCAIGEQLRAVEQSVMWWIGDWLRFGERKYGETYAQAIDATGFSQQTLMNAKWVASRYGQTSLRRENLTFGHHAVAAALPTLEREHVLQAAEDNGWSIGQLRSEVQKRREADDVPPPLHAEHPFGYGLRCMSRLVGAVFDMDPETFTGDGKGSPAQVHARQVLFYLLHTEAGFDQTTIAAGLRRNRSTVGHAIANITAMRDESGLDETFTRIGAFYRDLAKARETVPQIVKALAA